MIGYFLNNRISSFMVMAALITAGIISLYKLPVSLVPASDSPAVSILIEYPGMGPEKIEVLITKPVERIIKSVNGITEISSTSEEGKSRINVTFSEKTDIKIATVNLREKIELISDTFPEEVQEPVVYRYDPSDRPVIIAAVEIEGLSVEDVRDFADKKIKPALQRVDGISEINIAGGTIKEIQIETDRSRLEARGLTLGDISSAVKSSNISVPGGLIETGNGMNILTIPARFRTIEDIRDTILYAQNAGLVYLKDVADVSFARREKEDYSRYNGKDLVTLYIHRGSGANTLEVCNEVLKVLNSFTNLNLKIIYNQGAYIRSAVNNAALSGLHGMIIVFIVLAVFFRRKETVIPIALSIPCSMLIVPIFLYAGGRGINIMSLSGFALSAGIVVDSGIVIMVTIISWEDKTIRGILAAVNSVKSAVISSTLTTISVFAPVAMLSSRAQTMYGDMSFTVTRALCVSLFIAIIVTPSLYVTLSRFKRLKIPGEISSAIQSYPGKFEEKIVRLEKECYNSYKKILSYVFSKGLKILFISSCVVFLSVILYSLTDKDAASDNGGQEFYLYMEFPTGTSLGTTDNVVKGVEKIARELKGVESVSTKVEKWRGTLTVRTNPDLNFKKRGQLRLALKNSADTYLKAFSAFSYTSEADEMASSEITVHFLGDDSDVLKKITKEASSRIKSIEGIDECYLRYREGRPEYCLTLDRDKSSMSGVNASSVAERIRGALFGPVASKFIEDDREVDVRVRFASGDRDTIEHLMKGVVKNYKGDDVPISEILHLSEGEGPSRIYRMNGRRSLSVTAKPGDISIQDSERKIKQVLDSMNLPDEYTFQFDSKIEEFRKERDELILSVYISILLIYMILASLFESLLLPFLIMITIPLAAAGSIPLLFIAGIPVSPSVYMGFIMLAGIVVNNGILLIEPVNMAYRSGSLTADNLREKIWKGALRRFRPVMLTLMTTVLGMIPLLIGSGEGSSLWFPFALTVISGLIFSTLLTLAILPLAAFYFYKRAVEDIKPEGITADAIVQENDNYA